MHVAPVFGESAVIPSEDSYPDDASIAKQVVAALADRLGRTPESIRPEDDLLRDLGIDSMSMAELTVSVEQVVGTEIPGDEWLDTQTVGDLIRLLTRYAAHSDKTNSARSFRS